MRFPRSISEWIHHRSLPKSVPQPQRRRRILQLAELEERVLYSVAPLDAAALQSHQNPDAGAANSDHDAAGAATPTVDVVLATHDVAGEVGSATLEPVSADADEPPHDETSLLANAPADSTVSHHAHELVFVDANIEHSEQLLESLGKLDDPSRHIEVVMLSPDRDGIEQISETLATHDHLDAVHILSHAVDGAVKLGATWLHSGNLDAYAGTIAQWHDALSSDADLMIYGCDLAATAKGQFLIEALYALTGADVAASSDDTGHALLGGDWDLEFAAGSIETSTALSSELQGSWSGLLAPFTVTNTNNSGAGSLRQAISDANALAGLDTISFDITGAGPHTINLTSALPMISDAVIIDGWSEPDFAGTPVVELDGASAGAGVDGLHITAGGSTVRGLVINRFSGDGIELSSGGGNTIVGNIIGLDPTGTIARGNGEEGVNVYSSNNTIGGLTTAERNILSGNGYEGVALQNSAATNNVVQGNYLGTDISGTLDRGNTLNGVWIGGGASNNTIGGTAVGARNVISGNDDDGIEVADSTSVNNVIQGNYIGIAATGNAALANGDEGILLENAVSTLIGGTVDGAGNVIGGNVGNGIVVGGSPATGNVIQGNFIGTDATGTLNLSNSLAGVHFSDSSEAATGGAKNTTLGGTAAGAGNTIRFNTGDGVWVESTTAVGNAILGNLIDSNQGLGIDLGPNGVAANDSGDGDAGANRRQNYPLLATAVTSGGDITIIGTLSSTSSGGGRNYRIEFFANSTGDPSGYGEGERYLGFANVLTNGSGDASFNVVLPAAVSLGEFISATATDLTTNDTSEFAQNRTATSINTPPAITSNGGGGTAAINVAENSTAVTTVTATDADLPAQSLTYSISGGADAGKFALNSSTGALSFLAAPNYEAPTDAGGNNVYDVRVQVSDGTLTDTQDVAVTVTAVNDDLTPVSQFRVNSTTASAQHTWMEDRGSQQAVAIDASGNYVVVWSSQNQDGSDWGVFGRRYDRFGVARGGEFQINQYTGGDQNWANVAVAPNGGFVVAWSSEDQDGSGSGVFARSYDAAGNALGNEFQAHTVSLGDQKSPSVGIDAAGNSVVVWQGNGPGDSDGIFARRFDAAGTPLDATEQRVNTNLSLSHHNPAVSMNDSGQYAVVWDNNNGVFVRRFDTAGVPIGSVITVDGDSDSGEAAVALDNDGDFVVTWRDRSTDLLLFTDESVVARRYNAAGAPLGGEFTVSTSSGDQYDPSITMDSAGNFTIVWEGDGSGDASGVFGRKYNSTGLAISGEFRINQITSGTQDDASAAMMDPSNFVVVWSGNGPGDTNGVFARQFGTSPGNQPPTADAGGPYTIGEGDSLDLVSSGSSDPDGEPLIYAWDLDNDGVFGDVTGGSLTVDWATLQSFGIDDDGMYAIGLRVDDGFGGIDTAVTRLAVNDLAPIVSVSGAATATSGAVYTLNLTATDPGNDTINAWTIVWGDGTIESIAGNPSSAVHTYSNAGFTNNILVSTTDEDGATIPSHLILTSNATDTLFRFDADNGALEQEFAVSSGLGSPVDIEVGPDGLLYATGFTSNDVRRYNPATGALVDQFVTAGSGGLSAPSRIAFGPDGNLYVTSLNTDQVLRYDSSTGAFIDAFVAAGSGGLNEADGIEFGPDGNLYVASDAGRQILRYDGSTGAFLNQFATVANTGFTDLTFGPDGHLYVSNVSHNSVQRFDGATGALIGDFVTAGSGGINGAAGLKFGPDGNLYVVGFNSDDVRRYDGSSGAFLDTFVAAGSGQNQPINLAFTPALQVTVLANSPPNADSGGPYAVSEGGSVSLDGSGSSDPDSDPLAFAWDLNNDGAFGDVAGPSPVIAWTMLESFGIDNDGAHVIGLRVDDGRGGTHSTTTTVTVNNAPPTAVDDTGSGFTTDENTSLTTTSVLANDTDPAASDSLMVVSVDVTSTLGLVIDNGDGTFMYNPNGQFEWLATGQQATDGFSYTIGDGDGGSAMATVTITIDGVNDTPVITSNGGAATASVNIAENTLSVTTVTATDADLPSQTLTYSISDGPDALKFSIDSSTGVVSFVTAANFETPTDAGTDNVYDVTVQVSDGGGGTDTQSIAVMVTNSIDSTTIYLKGDTSPPFSDLSTVAPADTSLSNYDPARDSDAGLSINKGNSGADETDNSRHQTWVMSGPVNIASQQVQLIIWTDIKNGMNVAQTGDVVLGKNATVTAYLIDLPSATTASGGAVIATGSVTDATWGDGFVWEQKTIDFGAVNYSVAAGRHLAVKLVVDNSSSDDLWIAYDTTSFTSRLEIGEGNTAPAITSNGGGATAFINAAENTTAVTTVSATDADLPAQVLSYSIVGGADAAKFAINSSTGALQFISVPNFELPTDFLWDNVYQVQVTADDGAGGTDSQDIVVSVTDVDEFNTTALSDTDAAVDAVTENAPNGTPVGVAAFAADADATNNAIAYSLDDSAGGRFVVNAASGVVTVADGTLLNREAAASHNITVRATSSDTSFSTVDITINLNDDDEFDVGAVSDTNAAANAVNENAANGTAVGITLSASDADATNNTIIYSLDDSAGGRFAINATSGVVTVADGTLLNREAAASHNVTVRATGSDASFSTAVFTINLNDVDEFDVGAVSDTNAAANAVNEYAANGTAVGIAVSASDADATNNAVTYSLDDSAGGRFAINAASGVVTVANGTLLDREAAASHNVTVRATSSDTSFSTAVFTINLNDVDEFDVGAVNDTNAAANAVNEYAANGTAVGIAVSASDADATNNAITYSLDDSAGGRFAINAASGVVTVANGTLLDREAAVSHNITVRATSSDTSFSTALFTISVTDVNEMDVGPISDASAATDAAAENAAVGTVVGITTFADDPDGTDIVSYSLDDDAGGQFAIDTATGVVTVNAVLDFEAATSHTITVRATSTDGSFSTHGFTISVTDVNEFTVGLISDTSAAADAAAEHAAAGTVVGVTAFAGDPDGADIVSYNLDDDAGGRFAINSSTGVVTVADGTLLDREAAASHIISVRATSTDTSFSTRVFTIAVLPLNDNTPVFMSGSTTAINENQTIVQTLTATDADLPAQIMTFAITGGTDAVKFAINGANQLVFMIGPDFDAPTDVGTDNVYDVQVTANDGNGGLTPQSISVSVTSMNDNHPIITSPNSGSVAENTTAVLTVTATDADLPAQSLTYSISGGTDAGKFAINATTGVLTFAAPPDFEAPTDFDADNVYHVNVKVSDGISEQSQAIAVTVNNVDEFAVSAISDSNAAANAVNENAAAGTTVGITAIASDADAANNTITYSLDDNAGGRFTINLSSGVVTVASSLDRESAPSYDIIVRATSADTSFATQTFTIAINDVDEFDVGAVSDTNVAANAVDENAAAGATVGVTALATDSDAANNTITYSLVDNAGGRFTINSSNGVVTVAGPLDRASGPSHNIVVRATSADTSFATQSFTIAINDVDEFDVGGISDSDPAANTISELASVGTPVGITAFATDVDATDAVTYSLDDDAGRFAINSADGVVTVNGPLDYETAASHTIVVRATSTDGSFATRSFTVNLADANESNVGPIGDTDPAAEAVAENAAVGTAVGITALATDPDLMDAVSYSLDDDAGGRFAINATSGVVTVASAVDREMAPSYAITVRATSTDTSYNTRTFTIAVLDVDEFDVGAVSDSNAAINAVNENAANGSTVGLTAFAADATNNTITYSLDDTAGGRFAINATTGVVTVANGSLLNREAAASYSITARATSSDTSFSTRTFTISLNDVDEFDVGTIADSNAAANAVNENAINGTVVGVAAAAADSDATNNTITYSLDDTAGDRFAVNATTGVVSVNGALDFETASSHAIIVRATSTDGSFSTRNFTISVTGVNESGVGPISDIDAAADTAAENAAAGTVVGITAFADDPDGTDMVSYSLDDDAGGRFAIDSATGVVTVNPGAPGLDFETATSHAIIVRATSTDGSASTATLLIAVDNQNDAPAATGDSYLVNEDTTLAVAAAGVLTNDSDVDGDPLSAVLVSGPSNAASFNLNADGSFNYTPNANFNGTDSFTYQANDGAADSNFATVTITVNPVIDAPGPVTTPTTNPPAVEPGDDPPPVIETPPIEVDVEDLPTPGEPGPQTIVRITTELTPSPVRPPHDDVSQESSTPTFTVSVLQFPVPIAEPSEDTAESRVMADGTSDHAAPLSPPSASGDPPYAHLQRPGAFWKGLDEIRQAVDDEVQTQSVLVGAALATASGLSAGYVIWLARSGILLTSLLAQLPSWRSVDPLVILDYADDRRSKNPRDDETLEDVIATPSLGKRTS